MNRYIYIILSLFLCVTKGMSQSTYPVQVNVHLLPPYSLYLSDYYSGTREKLTVTLVNRDQFKPSVNVRLRMIITAPGGIRIQTNDNAYVEPITVETGAPVRLTQDDLAPYFQPNNLITQGYLAAGKLPEGMVEFCFQAIEIYTGQVLSASTCTRAWITSQKPPLLSLPRNNESIAFREPLNVLFQWTPLHQGLALVEYDFILKELWDNGMTPQAAFPYSPEIYRETTRSTSLIYGAMQPPLLPGKRYAWCVQAKAREGLDEVNLFQNDGYSEIRWFTLNDNCAAPQVLTATAERKRLNLEWNTLPEYIGFIVSYRLKSSSGETQAEWKEQQIQESNTILYGLQDGGTYEYRIASMCMAGQPVYTPVFVITLPEADSARLAQCGIMPDVNLSNQEPIKELKTSEEFKAGDFPITITRISGSNGTFTGVGWTIIPWLNDAKIAVEFNEIVINTDRQMISGFVEAMYDKMEGQIANLDEVFEGGFDVGNVKTGLTRTDYKFDFSIPGVESFELNDADELIITDSEGVPHTVGPPAAVEGQGNEGNKVVVFPMTVQDKNGDVYKVEKVPGPDGQDVAKATYLGNIGAPLPPGSFDPTQLNGDKAIVTFTRGDGKFGFDTWQPYYGSVSLIKDKYQKLYTDYYAPWKLVPAGQSDKIRATIVIKDESIKPELVIFKTPTGTTYRAERNGNDYTLQVTSGPEGDVQELYALYPRENDKYYTLGKIGIATYTQQHYSVVLVPVNNAPVDEVEIKQQLADTYGPVAVTWNVTTAENLPYEGSDQLMKNSTGLSTYNDAMKALNEKFKTERGYDPSTNYLFFLKATGADEKNERDFTGFMPRGAQFGYIFTSEIPKAKIAITVSHELGHGRFKLYHPFDQHYGTAAGTAARKTENIMSYGDDANHLAKWQWDQVNDPAMVVSVFEGDQRSGNLATNNIPENFLDGTTFNFITPTGKKITLPKRCAVNFNFGIATIAEIKYTIGYLYGFTVATEEDGVVTYTASIRDGKFLGYFDAAGKPHVDKLTAADTHNNVIMFVPGKDGIRYVKINIKLEPYKADVPIVEYAEFPVKPYPDKSLVILESPIVTYTTIQGLTKNKQEDWTLHSGFFKAFLTNHEGKSEHYLITKVVELRTAYRAVFQQFTDLECYDNWRADLRKIIDNSDGGIKDVPCVGKWEDILRSEPILFALWKTKPNQFYERFIVEFMKYVQESAVSKENFLANLSLQTTQYNATEFLRLCSNDEVSRISWEKRKILLQVLARQAIHGETETSIVKLVRYIPQADRSKLLDALIQLKDADDHDLLLRRFVGYHVDDLNDQEFYDFVGIIHGYANDVYHYDKSVFAQAKNKLEKRFFSFDPAFWTNKPISIDMQENLQIEFAFRHQFTWVEYEAVPVDPYQSVTLRFEDNKTSPQFSLDKNSTYTTSGLMAYALCYSVASDNLKIGGFVVLNTALMVTGIGELNAALAAGRTGGAILAGTDIALGVGTIMVETKYKDVLLRLPDKKGESILKFWEYANLIYAGGKVGSELLSRATAARQAAEKLIADGAAVDRAILDETIDQATNIERAGLNGEMSFIARAAAAPAAGSLARYGNVRFMYSGFQKSLGNNFTNFENALKSCADDVLKQFDQRPDLFYKLGDIEKATQQAIKTKLDEVALQAKDFGIFKTAAGNVPGKSQAVLFSKLKNTPEFATLGQNVDALNDVTKGNFLNDFNAVTDDVLKNIQGKGLLPAWQAAGKHAALRVQTNILEKLTTIAGRNRGITISKLKAAIDGDLGDLLVKADAAVLGKILDRLDMPHVTVEYLDEITRRLHDYPLLKQDLLNNPNWYETFDDIIQNPERYNEILSQGDIPTSGALKAWASGYWWKTLKDLADGFDGAVFDHLEKLLGKGKIVRQVTLDIKGPNGLTRTVRVDCMYFDEVTGKFILIDSKFSTKLKNWDTDWLNACTPNQTEVYPWLVNNTGLEITVKATTSEKITELSTVLNLAPGSKLQRSQTSLQIFGSAENLQVIGKEVKLY